MDGEVSVLFPSLVCYDRRHDKNRNESTSRLCCAGGPGEARCCGEPVYRAFFADVQAQLQRIKRAGAPSPSHGMLCFCSCMM